MVKKAELKVELKEKVMKTNYVLDPWQKEIIDIPWKTNLCINIGRQSGKSDTIAIKTAETIANNPKIRVLIISITEDQAQRMLQKIALHLFDNYPKLIAKGKDKKTGEMLKPTQHKINLTNKSWVVTKAVGQYGLGVLGMTVDVIVPDEAAYLPEAIWQAITPMLLTTGGVLWLLSTPNTQEGYFYEAYTKSDMGFKTYNFTSEQVAELRPEPQRTIMIEYLKREKARMTELEYAQQYLAQFLEELNQLYPDKLIKQSQSLQRTSNNSETSNPFPSGEYYLGMDIARMGGDETTFEILERVTESNKNVFYQREHLSFTYTLTTETEDKVIELDNKYKFIRIYVDSGGIGAPVFDHLVKKFKQDKVVPIDNSSRALDRDKNRKKKILKEDLYLNLKRLMEHGKIKLLKDDDITASLKSIVIESNKNTGEIRIHGRYAHITEGLIRAAWCVKDIHLNIYFESL